MNLHYTWFVAGVKGVYLDVLKYNTSTVLYITLIIRMEVCCVGTTAAKLALDFGTGWRIMDGVEGNGMDMAAAR
jgi:hypothetical protein